MDGILFVDKPENVTSRDVVNEISKIYDTKKVGHTGTLDPIATGVMIVCLGKYTKLVNELTSKSKEYLAVMKLGIKTDTKDITGKVIERSHTKIKKETIMEVFQNFPSIYLQEVPLYSAVKVNGKKLYEYARENQEVTLPKRQIKIYELEVISIRDDEITFRTVVSKGTYIRSLIEDLAKQMKTIATMKSLTRTKQGTISLKDCYKLKEINQNTPLKHLENIFSYPIYVINEEEKRKVSNGNQLVLPSEEQRLLLKDNQQVVALYEKENDTYKMIFKVI